MFRAAGAALLLASARASCIDDIAQVVQAGGELTKDIISTVQDCKSGDQSACSADAGAITGATGDLEKAVASTAEDCGHAGPGCTAAVEKIGDDISSLNSGVTAIVDGCAGPGHDTIKCIEAVITIAPKGIRIAGDIVSTVHACKRTSNEAGGCVDDIAKLVQAGVGLTKDIISTVNDCKSGDQSACSADAGAIAGATGDLEKAVASAAEDCGHAGPDCTAAVQKIGDDISSLNSGVTAIVDGCAGPGHDTLKCIEAVITIAPKGIHILADIAATVHACRKHSTFHGNSTVVV